MCPRASWERIYSGWTWFHNWDITLEYSVRRPSGLQSLTPNLSRMRNVGMQGINFNVQDPTEEARWQSVYMLESGTFDFAHHSPVIVPAGEK